jgi:hypothetical protein
LPGETAIAVTVFGVTVSVAIPLIPVSAAVTALEPRAAPVASPSEPIVATDVLAVVQVAVEVTLAVEPSLYVAVAVNC